MENYIKRLKKEIELKRKHNEETLKQLKERSIIYNANREKKKNYFHNNITTLLNKKRKPTNNNNNNKNGINDNNEINNDINDYYDECDDYIDDFMNNSFLSKKSFSNLNFCRPERFSFSKDKKKKKLFIRNQDEFTITKKIDKPKIETPQISNFTTNFSTPTPNSGISFDSDKNSKKNNIKTENAPVNFGFTSKIDNDTKKSMFDIKVKKDYEVKKKEGGLFGFTANINKEAAKYNDTNLFDISDKNKYEKKEGGLFGFDKSETTNTKVENTKSLFSSNKTGEDKKDNKDINETEEKKENESKTVSLFGDLNRLNNINEEGKTLFGEPKQPQPQLEQQAKPKPEPEKQVIIEKEEKSKTIDITPNKDKNAGVETPKKVSLFDSGINKTKDEKVEKEVITMPSLFGEKKVDNNNNKDKSNEEKEKDNNNKSLFDGGLLNLKEKKDEKKEEKKEVLNLSAFTELKNEEDKKEKEKVKENESKPLFGDLFNNNNESKIKENSTSLFINESSLFGKKEDTSVSEKKDNNKMGTLGLFSTDKKDNEKSTTPLFEFTNKEEKSTNNFTSLFGKKEEKNDNKPLINNSNFEEKKINIINSKGSLANDSNPFLNPSTPKNVEIIFNAENLKGSQNTISTNQTNLNTSSQFPSNINIFGANNEKRDLLYGVQPMDSGGMDMSPTLKPKNLFTSNNPSSNNNTFIFGNNQNSNLNIFGAPMNNNNNNSFFMNNNNNIFGNNQGNNFGQQSKGIFFSIGKK